MLWASLAPLFAFASRVGNGTQPVRLPLYVAMVITWLQRRLRCRRAASVSSRPFAPTAILRVDAKAEGLEKSFYMDAFQVRAEALLEDLLFRRSFMILYVN